MKDWYDVAVEYHRRTPGDGGLPLLSAEWQRELVALMLVQRDVNNGAYLQFLANHGREVYVYASRALRAIGAHKMAGIIDRCQALVDEHFPTKGRPTGEIRQLLPNPILDREGRTVKEAGSVLPQAVLARVYELSHEYMGYPEDVGPLAQQYYGPLVAGDKTA
ncbi:MAG: hypothetical protein JWO38_2625 [Gemmataceae bacterium]|nr:hypothetical protein [Gemmataceae bacterium]